MNFVVKIFYQKFAFFALHCFVWFSLLFWPTDGLKADSPEGLKASTFECEIALQFLARSERRSDSLNYTMKMTIYPPEKVSSSIQRNFKLKKPEAGILFREIDEQNKKDLALFRFVFSPWIYVDVFVESNRDFPSAKASLVWQSIVSPEFRVEQLSYIAHGRHPWKVSLPIEASMRYRAYLNRVLRNLREAFDGEFLHHRREAIFPQVDSQDLSFRYSPQDLMSLPEFEEMELVEVSDIDLFQWLRWQGADAQDLIRLRGHLLSLRGLLEESQGSRGLEGEAQLRFFYEEGLSPASRFWIGVQAPSGLIDWHSFEKVPGSIW